MANRYWVGGSQDWDSTAGTKWATSSGGTGGAAVPTSSDDVFFDAASGSVTVSMSGPGTARTCKSLNFTGFTGTWAGSVGVTIYEGSLTLGAGMTRTYTGGIILSASTPGHTITSNGKTLNSLITLSGSGGGYTTTDAFNNTGNFICASTNGTFTLGGTFTLSGNLQLVLGSFSSVSYAVTVQALRSNGGSTRTLNLGSSTWTITHQSGGYILDMSSTGMTLIPGTSTIKITTSGGPGYIASLGGLTYWNLWDATTASGLTEYYGNNTFNEFKVDPGRTVRFVKDSVNTATTWAISGTSGNAVTIAGSGFASGPRAYLVKAGGDIVDLTYITYSDIAVSGGSWYAGTGSTDAGNNSGWVVRFTNPENAYADDGSFATVASPDGVLSISLSGDAGLNYSPALTKTFGGSETSEVFGAGSTELWGRSWTGDDVDDTSFRLKVATGSGVSTYKTFGFSIGSSTIVTGIEVSVNGKWDGTTFSLDHIKVKIYYGTSVVPVGPGSQAYVSDGRKNGEGPGAGTGVLAFYDQGGWKACDTGAAVAA